MQSFGILRKLLGINQLTIAQEVGVSRVSLQYYENGTRIPTRRMAAKIDRGIVAIMDRRAIAAMTELREAKARAGEPAPEQANEKAAV
jgi:transcriptional regulator with XRE-family HTH domain